MKKNQKTYNNIKKKVAPNNKLLGKSNSSEKNSINTNDKYVEQLKFLSKLTSDYFFSVIIKSDNSKTLEFITNGFNKEFGFSFQNLLKPKAWKKHIQEEDHFVIAEINRSIYSNKKTTAVYRIIKKDGTFSWHQGTFEPIYDKKSKRVVKFFGASKDITAIKLAEQNLVDLNNQLAKHVKEKTAQLETAIANLKHEVSIRTVAENQVREINKTINESAKNLDKKLRESEYKHLWNVFEHSKIPTVTIAQNGLCLNYNKAAELLFGYTHEELPNVESWFNKLISRETYRSIVRKVTYKAISGQQPSYNYEIKIINKSGEEKHLVLQVNSILHEGAPVGIQLGQFTDITDKKRIEQTLKSTLEKYKVLFSTFPLGITISDSTGKIVESNKTAEKLLGLPSSEHTIRNIDSSNWKIIRPDGSEMPVMEYASVRALNEGKIISNVEMGVYKSENDISWISVTAAPLAHSAGGGVVVAYGDITEKIVTGNALKESEERYRMLIDSSPFALFVHQNGKVLYANDACIKMFHANNSSQVVGKNLYDYMHQDYLEIATTKLVRPNVNTDVLPKIEVKYYCLDNQLIDVEASAIPIIYDNKKAILVAATDVTEKNNAIRKLKESEFQLKFLVEKSPIVIFKIDKNGLFTLSEGNGLAKLGLSSGQVVGASVFELYKDYPEILSAIKKSIEGTTTREILKINNIVFETYFTPIFNNNNIVEFVGGIAYDITEQREFENELLKSVKQWQTTFDSVSDAVWLVDLNSVIIRANKTSEKILGKPLNQIIGKHCFEVVHGDSKPITDCPVQRMKVSLQRESMVYHTENKWFQAIADPIIDESGNLAGAVHTISDITERYIIQERLEKSEALYRLISENSSDVIWILDLNTLTFTYVSPSVYKLRGYTPEEVCKQDLREVLTSDSYKFVTTAIKQRIGELITGNSIDIYSTDEVFQIHKDGRIIPTEVSTTLLFDSNGNHTSLLGVTRDITDRKESQKKLYDSEKRYRKIVEMSPEAIFIHKDGEFLFANKATLDLVGVSSFDELCSKKLVDYLHPNSVELILQRIDLLAKGEADQLPYAEYVIIKNDGTLAYIESTAAVIDYYGKLAIQSVARDVTQRKEAERALKESQDRFKQVVEYSPNAILVHQNGNIVYANPTAVKLVCANSIEDLLYKNVMDFVHPDYKEIVIERFKEAAISMRPLPPQEERIFRLDGKELDVEVVSVPFYLNNSLAYQLIIRDITDEKAKTEELRKLSRAVEQNATSVYITNINGEIEYANPKFLETTGYQLSEILGKNSRILSSGLQSKEFYKNLWQIILAGNEWRGEFQNKKKNGDIYWEFTSISPIKDKSGKITHFVAIKEDITERKKIDDEMHIIKDETEHAYKVKTSLLANMSHELRTPLNGIIGFSELLKDYIGDQDAHVMIEKIIKSGQRLSSTFTEILSLTELEMGDVTVKNEQVDLALFCHEMMLLFKDRAEVKGLDINVDLPSDSVSTFSDEGWLTRIATHLIENAIKFTYEGSITIQLKSPVVKDNIEYSIVNIIDTGIGIQEEEKSTLFKEFRQVSEGTRRDFEGLGLGLSLAKRMAANLNCLTSFESEYGKGSTFSIWIPLLLEAPIDKLSPEPVMFNEITKSKNDSEDLQILLVEDNPLNIEVVEKFLSKRGVITPVRDGESAIKAVQNSNFDLLLVDISLGHGIDGIEVLKQIRLMENYSNIPAIALTAYVSETNKKRFKAAGFNGFLGKPFEKKDLLNYISKIFNQPQK